MVKTILQLISELSNPPSLWIARDGFCWTHLTKETDPPGSEVPELAGPGERGTRGQCSQPLRSGLHKRYIWPIGKKAFSTKTMGHLHLQGNVQVYNVRIPAKALGMARGGSPRAPKWGFQPPNLEFGFEMRCPSLETKQETTAEPEETTPE